eukprot:4895662-Amphidinium_carterae.1
MLAKFQHSAIGPSMVSGKLTTAAILVYSHSEQKDRGYDPSFGARPIKRSIVANVRTLAIDEQHFAP